MVLNFIKSYKIRRKKYPVKLSYKIVSKKGKKNRERNISPGLILFISGIIILILGLYHKKNAGETSSKIVPASFAKSELLKVAENVNRDNPNIFALYEILKEQVGKPYKYGGTGPDSFDCSGLVQYAFLQIGIKLPRVAADQSHEGTEISKDNLRFGDIVFFAKDGTNINHEGIYIGNGEMLHAPQTGDVIRISSINTGYYNKVYKKAIRVLN